jgi:hypothetical protein
MAVEGQMAEEKTEAYRVINRGPERAGRGPREGTERHRRSRGPSRRHRAAAVIERTDFQGPKVNLLKTLIAKLKFFAK